MAYYDGSSKRRLGTWYNKLRYYLVEAKTPKVQNRRFKRRPT